MKNSTALPLALATPGVYLLGKPGARKKKQLQNPSLVALENSLRDFLKKLGYDVTIAYSPTSSTPGRPGTNSPRSSTRK